MNQGSNLSVALLISDIEEVKEITNVFRKLGVIPYFYEDLKSFWNGTLERIPALAIVDVKKMSDGNLILKNHPNVMTEELPIIFYYTQNTEPLLVSTQEIFHLGTIKQKSNYENVFKGLLKRINKIIQLEQENHNLKIKLQASVDEIKLKEEALVKKNNLEKYSELSKLLCHKIATESLEKDFESILSHLIDSTEAFDTFSIVELSFNGQKLVSPINHSAKYRSIPSLWLGQTSENGIQFFAENMASQVANEILGSRVVALSIKGNAQNPEKIIFIKAIDDLCFNHFDWTLLESFLSGLFASQKLHEKNHHQSLKEFHSTFDALTFIDQLNFKNKTEELSLIQLDLSSILSVVQRDGTQKFFWKKFRDDFIYRLKVQSKIDFRLFENGVTGLGFLVNNKESDIFFNELKNFADRFAYWKYFENNELTIFQEINPKVSMTPTSAYGYLKNVIKDEVNHSAKAQSIKWNRSIENEI